MSIFTIFKIYMYFIYIFDVRIIPESNENLRPFIIEFLK